MTTHVSEAPAVPDEHLPMSPPPATLALGGRMVTIGASVGGLSALLVLAANFEGDDHAAAVFATIAVLGGIGLVAGLLLVAFGSIWWAVRFVRHPGVHEQLPKRLAWGLIAWAGAIVVGIAVSAGLGHIPTVGYALMAASFALWFAGAVCLAIGSYRTRRTPRPSRITLTSPHHLP